MIKASTILGAGVLVAGLAAPLAASAGSSDETLAFIVGAAVGHAVGDHHHVHPVHRRYHGHLPPARPYRHLGWHKRPHAVQRWQHERRLHDHRRHEPKRDHRRHDRRYDRRDGRRDHRRG